MINDRQINRRVPPQLFYAKIAIDYLSNKLQVFLTYRQIVGLLCEGAPNEQSYGGIDVNPIAREQTVIHSWEQLKSYQLPSVNVELILCNVREHKRMMVRYVMIDPEFFILIEPDFSV